MSLSQHRLLNLRPFGISWNLWRCEDPCLHNVFPFWAEPKTCTGLLSYHSPRPSVLGQHQTPTLNTACVFCHPGSNPRYWHCFVDEDAMSWTKSSLGFFFYVEWFRCVCCLYQTLSICLLKWYCKSSKALFSKHTPAAGPAGSQDVAVFGNWTAFVFQIWV